MENGSLKVYWKKVCKPISFNNIVELLGSHVCKAVKAIAKAIKGSIESERLPCSRGLKCPGEQV